MGCPRREFRHRVAAACGLALETEPPAQFVWLINSKSYGCETLYWWLHSGYTATDKKKGQPVRVGLNLLGTRMNAGFP